MAGRVRVLVDSFVIRSCHSHSAARLCVTSGRHRMCCHGGCAFKIALHQGTSDSHLMQRAQPSVVPQCFLSSHLDFVCHRGRGLGRGARAPSRRAACSKLQEGTQRSRRARHRLDGRGLSMRQQSGVSRVTARTCPACREDFGLARVTGVAGGAVALVAVADAAIVAIVWARLHRAVCSRPRGNALARAIDAISTVVTIVRARFEVARVAHPTRVAHARATITDAVARATVRASWARAVLANKARVARASPIGTRTVARAAIWACETGARGRVGVDAPEGIGLTTRRNSRDGVWPSMGCWSWIAGHGLRVMGCWSETRGTYTRLPHKRRRPSQ